MLKLIITKIQDLLTIKTVKKNSEVRKYFVVNNKNPLDEPVKKDSIVSCARRGHCSLSPLSPMLILKPNLQTFLIKC